ncbi:MAG TPA: hypothetical protein VFX15_02745 [Actinomycetes bacterium]|nr:hypothetical protein [Actinomycetes bacterium]
MKPIDPDATPVHIARQRGGRTGLVHGPAPMLPREFTRAHALKDRKGRKGAKARARMKRCLLRRYGIA